MTRPYCRRIVALALASLIVLSVALPLSAQYLWTKTAHLAYSGNTFRLEPPASFNLLGSKVTGGGVLPSADNGGIGTFTLIPKRGDEIYFAFVLNAPLGYAGKSLGTYTVIGGIGRYVNASGSGEIRLWRNTVGDPSGMVNDMYLNGELNY
jgi:hypothetical protein